MSSGPTYQCASSASLKLTRWAAVIQAMYKQCLHLSSISNVAQQCVMATADAATSSNTGMFVTVTANEAYSRLT